MNRKEKINLINQFEIGELTIEIFQRPKLRIRNVQISDFKRSREISHDEDIYYSNSTISGINPYTDQFYGIININIVK